MTSETVLTPFWRNQTEFWISTEVTDIEALQYTYPEFQGVNTGDQQALQSAIAQKVNQLYGPGSTPMSKRSQQLPVNIPTKRSHKLMSRKNRLSDMLGKIFGGNGGQYSDWTARVTFDRTEVGGSFSVVFFLGSVPEDSSTWLTCPQFVGAHHAFVHSMQCTKCDQDRFMEEGFVSLNPAIADKTTFGSFLSNLVVPWLTAGLQWRVRAVSGSIVRCETKCELIPSFSFSFRRMVRWSTLNPCKWKY